MDIPRLGMERQKSPHSQIQPGSERSGEADSVFASVAVACDGMPAVLQSVRPPQPLPIVQQGGLVLKPGINQNPAALADFVQAVHDGRPVAGLTHKFYRYPARFSPTFARAAIETFTQRGDLVLDPFVGGGTTLVEARVLGRPAVGADISELARFVSRVKATVLSETDLEELRKWMTSMAASLSVWTRPREALLEDARSDNLDAVDTWRVKRLVAQAIASIDGTEPPQQAGFARCLILKTAQWALDGRKRVPSVAEFRVKLNENFEGMLAGMEAFGRAANDAGADYPGSLPLEAICLATPAAELDDHEVWQTLPPPRLILTSPPYPGLHVLYHRWQVRGRRETPAPFWISNSLDGHGASHYTFGTRENDERYFAAALSSFKSLSRLSDSETILVQLVGFSAPERQLPRYLETVADAGFDEVRLHGGSRLWREVPNRKWHADIKGPTAGGKEVVLVHRLRRRRSSWPRLGATGDGTTDSEEANSSIRARAYSV